MLISWDWLSQYVRLTVDPDTMALKFAMAGLNHESTSDLGYDTVLDLEVTSNRGDCLGHIGVAREAAVLLDQTLQIPQVELSPSAERADACIQVENQFLDGCPEYSARVMRGVRVGPSPDWLRRRLEAVGINSVNNIVDVTNYVMLECGQPLHAFDLQHLRGGKIVVRRARPGEQFLAIDHRTYTLDEQMVVIADAERAVAIGGVMGGAETEVSETTTDLLIESARFRPLSIRRTARKLKLHSPSSYRFERSPDPAGIDWASQRCCQLIAEVAGGEVLDGAVVGGDPPPPRESIGLRYSQIPRVLGIEVPRDQSEKILVALGCSIQRRDPSQLTVVPPTWRIDLTREADLIEEVARIHGYDQIPEDVAVPIGTAMPRPKDRVLELVRRVLIARGIDEAMTPSVTPESLERLGSPWTDRPPLTTETQMLVGAKCLRRSLLPSLLQARRYNQAQSLRNAELYEVATIFLPGEDPRALPQETCALGIVAKGDLRFIKGIVEEIVSQVAGRNAEFAWNLADVPLMARGTALHIQHSDRTVGFVGLMAPETGESLDLDGPAAVAELSVDVLTELLVPVRTATAISPYPAVARDLNFIVDEKVRWAQIAAVCRESGTELLRDVEYRETYRDPQKDGPGKKRILLTLYFQSMERTLTSDEVDAAVNGVIRSCQSALQARLLAG